MTGGRELEVFTRNLKRILPEFRKLHASLAARPQFGAVRLEACSNRMPEELKLIVANRSLEFRVQCNSNEVIEISFGVLRRDRFNSIYGLCGLLIDDSLELFGSRVQEILEVTEQLIQGNAARKIEEAELARIHSIFSVSTVHLERGLTPPATIVPPDRLTDLAHMYMNAHPEIFEQPHDRFPDIHRADEVREWIVTIPEFANLSATDLRVLCYGIFVTIKVICIGRQHSHMRNHM